MEPKEQILFVSSKHFDMLALGQADGPILRPGTLLAVCFDGEWFDGLVIEHQFKSGRYYLNGQGPLRELKPGMKVKLL